MSLSPGEPDRAYPDGRPLSEQPRWRQDFPSDIPEDQALARREFTKFLVLTSGAFVAGQCWIGGMSLLRDESPLPEKRIAAEGEVPAGGFEFRYPTEDDPCLLLRLPGGRLVAYGQRRHPRAGAGATSLPVPQRLLRAGGGAAGGRPAAAPAAAGHPGGAGRGHLCDRGGAEDRMKTRLTRAQKATIVGGISLFVTL